MRTKTESEYIYEILDGILVIIDLNREGTVSVTNDIKNVLQEIKSEIGSLPGKIIYRDSQGEFDGIEHKDGTFKRFYPIRETNQNKALEKVKSL